MLLSADTFYTVVRGTQMSDDERVTEYVKRKIQEGRADGYTVREERGWFGGPPEYVVRNESGQEVARGSEKSSFGRTWAEFEDKTGERIRVERDGWGGTGFQTISDSSPSPYMLVHEKDSFLLKKESDGSSRSSTSSPAGSSSGGASGSYSGGGGGGGYRSAARSEPASGSLLGGLVKAVMALGVMGAIGLGISQAPISEWRHDRAREVANRQVMQRPSPPASKTPHAPRTKPRPAGKLAPAQEPVQSPRTAAERKTFPNISMGPLVPQSRFHDVFKVNPSGSLNEKLDALYEKSEYLSQRGLEGEAYEIYQRILAMEPNYIPAVKGMWHVCWRLRKEGEADYWSKKAGALDSLQLAYQWHVSDLSSRSNNSRPDLEARVTPEAARRQPASQVSAPTVTPAPSRPRQQVSPKMTREAMQRQIKEYALQLRRKQDPVLWCRKGELEYAMTYYEDAHKSFQHASTMDIEFQDEIGLRQARQLMPKAERAVAYLKHLKRTGQPLPRFETVFDPYVRTDIPQGILEGTTGIEDLRGP